MYRRGLIRLAAVAAVLAVPMGAWTMSAGLGGATASVRPVERVDRCDTRGEVTLCMHADDAPEQDLGTSTADVRERAAEIRADADLSVSADLSTSADPTGPLPVLHNSPGCTGDGVSGKRVQALYVVPAGRSDRYAAVRASLVTFVTRVDDVFQASSALTGGNLAIRWVTDPGCALSLPRVDVSAGAETSFATLISDLQAAGYGRSDRKYLVMVDTPARGYCGVAQQYMDDSASAANWNNGRVAQFARVDTQCWGRGDHSTEAHELVHTLGGVQRTAPNSTPYGHCVDEQDLMCYADSSSTVLRSVCATVAEDYLDCRADDYFNANPTPGSYLATRWNVARSEFLAVPDAPTLAVSPVREVRGTPFPLVAAPWVPSGQTSAITWSLTPGCAVSTTASGTTGTCPPSVTGPLTVSATLAQSDGRTATATAAATSESGANPSILPAPLSPGATTGPTAPPATAPARAPGAAPTALPTRVVISVGTSAARVRGRGRVTVTGHLRRPAQDSLTGFTAAATVILQWRSGTGSTWRPLRTVRTGDGSLRATVRPATVARPGQVVVLRWRYAGSNAAQAAVSKAVRVRLAS